MAASIFSIHNSSVSSKTSALGSSSLRQKSTVTHCYQNSGAERKARNKNYYELLGICSDSSPQQIKEAYRKLQKIYHPDIAGQRGHEYTLVLNEAYNVLMREDLRKDYDVSIGQVRVASGGDLSNLGFSSWNGTLRPQALFVDENACIGCRECVHQAGNTFAMDETLGCARVKVQYGDEDKNIEVSVESCPLNCIHWVDTEDLPVLEHLVQPRAKGGHGIYGQGWERPANVFAAAKYFHKQLKHQSENQRRNAGPPSHEEETPAQAQARESARMEMQMHSFSRIWNWVKSVTK